jgi:hypothetical protein
MASERGSVTAFATLAALGLPMAVAVVVALLLASACERVGTRVTAGEETPPRGAAPTGEPGPWERACPDLPPSRPAGFAIRYEVHDYEAPERLVRVDVVEASESCPPDEMPGFLLTYYSPRACLGVPAVEMDRLYGVLVGHDIAAARTRPLPARPHHGGMALGFVLDGRRCLVADVTNSSEVEPATADRFRAAAGEVHDAIYAAQQAALGASPDAAPAPAPATPASGVEPSAPR